MKVAGLGFRSGATAASMHSALGQAEALGGPVAALATHQGKTGSVELETFARTRGLALHYVEVRDVATPTQSAKVLAHAGTGSVAEAAALVLAGPSARLLVARVISADGLATAAIAEGAP